MDNESEPIALYDEIDEAHVSTSWTGRVSISGWFCPICKTLNRVPMQHNVPCQCRSCKTPFVRGGNGVWISRQAAQDGQQ